MAAEKRDVRLVIADTHIDLVAPEFDIRFKSRESFRRFRAWIETARIVGTEGVRPVQTALTEDVREEWYALAIGGGDRIALHHFSAGDVDLAVTLSEERWREIGHAVLASSGEVM